jgi:hypothetical protein
MNGRVNLLLPVIMTICAVLAVAGAALTHSGLAAYTWPVNTVIWCWCWYGMTRINRRLQGELDAARRVRAGGRS